MLMLISEWSSGSRLNSGAPHSRQNASSQPASGWRQVLSRSSPATIRNPEPSTRASAEAAVPVRRWQRVQWQ